MDVLGFIKFPQDAFLEDIKLETILEDQLVDQLGVMDASSIIVWTRMLSESSNWPKDNPIDVLSLFCKCIDAGIFPPEKLLKLIAQNFDKFLSTCTNGGHPTLDELFFVSGNKPIRKKLLDERNNLIARDICILIKFFGLSKPKAREVVGEKVNQNLKVEVSSVKIKTDLDDRMLKHIYDEYSNFWENLYSKHQPQDLDKFLLTFPKTQQEEIKKIMEK